MQIITQFEMLLSLISVKHIQHVDTSFSQLQKSSQQPPLWYHLVFKVNFEEGLLQPKIIFSAASDVSKIFMGILFSAGDFGVGSIKDIIIIFEE